MIALVSVGFAHRNMQPELAAYLAAGGSLDDICGSMGGDDIAPSSDCEACRLSDSLIHLPVCDHRIITTTDATFVFGFVAKRLIQSQGLDPARLTRAPPQA